MSSEHSDFLRGAGGDDRDQTRTEEKLRGAEERYRSLVEQIPAILYIADFGRGGKWSYVSPQVEKLLGFPQQEWIADPELWARRIHPDDLSEALAEEERARRTGEPLASEYRMFSKDGRVVWIRDQARVVEAVPGGDPFLQGLMFDISEQKRAEQALRESEASLKMFISSLDEIVFELARDGTYVRVLSNNEELLIAPPEELVGRRIRDVLGEEMAAPFEESIKRVLDSRHPESLEYPLVVNGKEYWFLSRLAPIPVQGSDPETVSMLVRDITDRKGAEEELRRSVELLRRTDQERRRLLSRLVTAQEEERARIAADIHDDSIQVLTALGLRLDLLRRHVSQPEQEYAFVELETTLEQATMRLRHLLFELRPPSLDREGLAAAMRAHLEQLKKESDLEYVVNDRLQREPPAELRTLVYRIAQEALTNVRKHAGASRVDVTLEDRLGGYAITVKDDGSGFRPEVAAANMPGHLGLTSMRERAEIAGGWCEVTSIPDGGTTVQFWVPGENGSQAKTG